MDLDVGGYHDSSRIGRRWGRRSSLRGLVVAISTAKWPARSDAKLCDQEMNEEIEFAAYIAGRILKTHDKERDDLPAAQAENYFGGGGTGSSAVSVATVEVVAFFICSFVSQAQAVLPLPGCEATPEVRKIIDEKLESNLLDKMKFSERLAYHPEDLMTRYPRDLEPFVRYSNLMNEYAPEEVRRESVRDRWVQSAKDHPGDPLALVIAGKALVGKDTPQAISLLDAARARAPDFSWVRILGD